MSLSTSWKQFIKRAVVCIGLVLLTAVAAFAEIDGSSAGHRYTETEYEKTKGQYPSMQKLASQGTIPVPGLARTHSLIQEGGELVDESTDSMIPQGTCVVDDYILVTAYSADGKRTVTGSDGKTEKVKYTYPSVLYVIDKNHTNQEDGGYLCTISLYEKPESGAVSQAEGDSFKGVKPCRNHVGGICYDGKDRIYVAKSSTRYVSTISKQTLQAAVRWAQNQHTDAVALSFEQNLFLDYTISFLTWFKDRLWIGVCNLTTSGSVYGFDISENEDGTLSEKKALSFSVPEKANGLAFYENADGRCFMAVNCSYRRDVNHYDYTSKMHVYEVGMTAGAVETSSSFASYTMPPMAEEIDIVGDDFYTIYESGATKYKDCQYKLDCITKGKATDIFYKLKLEDVDTADDPFESDDGLILDASVTPDLHEDLSDRVVEITGTYRSQYGITIDSGFLYSDAFLAGQSAVRRDLGPDTKLTKMSVLLSAAAYYQLHISGILEKMSFDKINYYNYSRKATYENNDFVAFSVAKKTILYHDEEYVLYVVPVRGAPNSAEWFSNYNVGKGDDHKGFDKASEGVLSVLADSFFSKDGSDPEHRRILLTGHGRGAAVSNLIAGRLSEDQEYVKLPGIFSYNFACPAVSKNAGVSYTNIFNFNNPEDPTTVIPLENWGFHRYGQLISLPVDDNVGRRFNATTKNNYPGAGNQDDYVYTIRSLAYSQKDFEDPDRKVFFDLVAMGLGGVNDVAVENLFFGERWDKAGLNFWKQELIDKANRLFRNPGVLEEVISDRAKEYNDLIEEITKQQKEVAEARAKAQDSGKEYDFASWVLDHETFIRKVVMMTNVGISEEADLEKAKKTAQNECVSNMSALLNGGLNVLALYRGGVEGVGFPAGVKAAQSPDYYVTAVNSRYFGYNGWAGSEDAVISAPDEVGIDSIDGRCFSGCWNLETISYRGDLKYVGTGAFGGCTQLQEAPFIDGLVYIGKNGFSSCRNLSGKDGTFTIKSGLREMGDNAFSGCYRLGENLVIEGSETSIGAGAFKDCTSIRNVTLPADAVYDTVTKDPYAGSSSKKYGTFVGCTGIETLHYTVGESGIMPDWSMSSDLNTNAGFYKYGDIAYQTKDSLKKVILDEGITQIGVNAFYLNSLQQIELPLSLETIGERAFYEQKNLDLALMTDHMLSIGTSAFAGCSNLTAKNSTLQFSVNMQEIGSSAFSGCTNLGDTLVIEGSETRIGTGAFKNCTSFRYVKMPVDADYDSVTGYSAGSGFDYYGSFVGCSGVEILHFTPGTSKAMKDWSATALQEDNDGDDNYYKGSLAFQAKDSLKTVILEEGITRIGNYAFYESKFQRIDIPSTLKEIGEYAFWEQKNVEKIGLLDGLQSIGQAAFYGCENLGEQHFPSGIQEIGDHAFYGCSNLSVKGGTLTFPEGLTELGKYAFMKCPKLADSLVIQGADTRIGKFAFAGCTSIRSVTMPVDTEYDTLYYSYTDGIGYNGSFGGCSGVETLHYTAGKTGIMWDWVEYNASEENNEHLKSGGIIYQSRDSLKTVILDEGIVHVGDYAFNECYSLEKAVLPSSLKSIGISAFGNDSSLVTADLPSGLESVGNYAFSFDKSLASINLPSSLKSIGNQAFCGCKSAVFRIDEPLEKLESIGRQAFEDGPDTLTAFYLSDQLHSIGEDAFGGRQGKLTLFGWKGTDGETFARNEEYTFIPVYDPQIRPSAEAGFPGGRIRFTAEMYTKNCRKTEAAGWRIEGNGSASTMIDEQGLLIVGKDETAEQIEVLAGFAGDDGNTYSASCLLKIREAVPQELTLAEKPRLSGTYGDAVSDMAITGGRVLLGDQEAAGSWQITDENAGDQPPVDCSPAYKLTFTLSDETVSAAGNTISCSVVPEIAPRDISAPGVAAEIDASGLVYDGTEKKPAVILSDTYAALTDTDFSVVFSDNIHAGAAVVLIGGTGNYTGSRTETFRISQADLADAEAVLSQDSFTADGTQKRPEVTVTFGQLLLEEGRDYEVSYEDNVRAGTARAVITAGGEGDYTGSLVLPFTIHEPDEGTVIQEDAFRGSSLKKAQIGAGVIAIREGAFADCADLSAVYFYGDAPEIAADSFANVTAKAYYPVDNATWTADRLNSYGGNLQWSCWDPATGEEILFSLEEETCRISLEEVTCTYNGKEHRPEVSVLYRNRALKEGIDYTVAYADNIESGTAKVTITGKGRYSGTVTVDFQILEPVPQHIDVTGLELSRSSAEIATTKTLQLTAKVLPIDATDQTVTWTSSDPSIATVDQKGLVRAKKYGKATITARTGNGMTASCAVQTRFYDVNNKGKSYYTPVYWAVDRGITVCTVTFRPEDPVTRGEFVAFLWRVAGEPKSTARVSFKDVNSKAKFYKAIRWAVGKGIIKGYSDGTFKSENNVTRGETATMIWRYAGRPNPKTKKSPFSDTKVSTADSYKAILWGSENGIIKGSGGKFLKNDGCTRGQVVTFLYRMRKK